MNDHTLSATRGDNTKLAQWLLQVLQMPAQDTEDTSIDAGDDVQLQLLLHRDYHLRFYQQLPDFIMALLTDGLPVPVSSVPLLYHLAGCSECHQAYLDLYDAMRTAIQPQGQRFSLGQGTRTLAATPHRMLAHLCQSVISQAEALLRQARHEHANEDAAARSLLLLALRISSHIGQANVRREALQDLVRVAALFAGATAPAEEDPNVHAYTPVLTGAGGLRRGKVMRHGDPGLRPQHQEQPVINLQSHALEGSIMQRGSMLELHLHDLATASRGHFVSISVLLGSLIEPVRWIGGNPCAIRSAVPVDLAGTLVTPLGETALQLSNPEERNLLEATFMLLEVRPLSE